MPEIYSYLGLEFCHETRSEEDTDGFSPPVLWEVNFRSETERELLTGADPEVLARSPAVDALSEGSVCAVSQA